MQSPRSRSRRQHRPRPQARFLGQGLLILLPLIVLAAAGLWSLRGQRQAVGQRARQEAQAKADLLASNLLRKIEDRLQGFHPPVPLDEQDDPFPFLYPLNPAPPEDLIAFHRYQQAIDDPAELDKILAEYPSALSASGVPLAVLIHYQKFLNADPAMAVSARTTLEEYAGELQPSVISEPILAGIHSSRISRWQAHEKIRTILRENLASLRSRRQSKWADGPDGTPWRFEILADSSQPDRQIVHAAPLDWLLREMTGPVAEEYLGYEISFDGRPLWPPPGFGEARPFASASEKALSVTAFLTNPQKLYAQHDRQVRWAIGIIAAAALTALFGLWITHRAFLKQEAVNQMKSNFVSSVSHELRAPIASIRLMAERLRAGKVGGAEKRSEYFAFIEQESRRLATLVENVLDFSRIEDGKKIYHFKETDIEQLATDTVQLMRPHAAERKVTLATDFHPPGADPSIDALEIQQALINLIDNAIKYSPEGGAITIGLDGSDSPGRFRLWVQDHGEGIPIGEQQKIFARFYRVGSELERETQGVGIGLSIVRHTAEAHGGTASVQSRPGAGSRFNLELPIVQA